MAIHAGHTGIVVQDLDRVARFYKDVIGLTRKRAGSVARGRRWTYCWA